MCFRAEEASQMKLKLKARVNRSDARTIRHALEQLSARGSISRHEYRRYTELRGDDDYLPVALL
jgi:hypothetical protein